MNTTTISDEVVSHRLAANPTIDLSVISKREDVDAVIEASRH